jgi:hypothetical protein
VLFLPNEFLNAEFFDRTQIIDHAHAVLRTVALVEIPDARAGERFAIKTEYSLRALQFGTVLDSAMNAVLRLLRIIAVTSETPVRVALICHAERAVHAAGGDMECRDGVFRQDWHWRRHQKISLRSGGTICATN